MLLIIGRALSTIFQSLFIKKLPVRRKFHASFAVVPKEGGAMAHPLLFCTKKDTAQESSLHVRVFFLLYAREFSGLRVTGLMPYQVPRRALSSSFFFFLESFS